MLIDNVSPTQYVQGYQHVSTGQYVLHVSLGHRSGLVDYDLGSLAEILEMLRHSSVSGWGPSVET